MIPNLRELNLFKGNPLTDRDWFHNFKKIFEWLTNGLYDLTIGNLTSNGNVTIEGNLTVNGTANIDGSGNGGNGNGGNGNGGITQELQNIINGQNTMSKVSQVNGFNHDFMSNESNVIFTLASNYSVGDNSISLTFIQPTSLDEFKIRHSYPFMVQIWDGINKSYAILTADDGSTTGTNVFTLDNPLTNLNGAQVGYSTSGTICQTQMLTVNNGIGSIPTLTGQAASLPENIYTYYIPETVDGTLSLGNFFSPTKIYRATSNTINTIVVSADTNDSAMFPVMQLVGNPASPTVIMAYNSLNNQFIEFTLSANTTYDSINQLLTFTVNEDTTALNSTSWFVFKLGIVSASVMNSSEQTSPSVLSPSAIAETPNPPWKFDDNFNRANGYVNNGWTTVQVVGGINQDWARNLSILNNQLVQSAGSTGGNNFEGYIYRKIDEADAIDIYFDKAYSFGSNWNDSRNVTNIAFVWQGDPNNMSVWGADGNASYTKDGFAVHIRMGGGTAPNNFNLQLEYRISGTLVHSYMISTNTEINNWRRFRLHIDKRGNLKYKIYTPSSTEPNSWTGLYNNVGRLLPLNFTNQFTIWGHTTLYNTGSSTLFSYIDNLSLTGRLGMAKILYSFPTQTGNKITISSAFPIADIANEVPANYGVAGYLG